MTMPHLCIVNLNFYNMLNIYNIKIKTLFPVTQFICLSCYERDFKCAVDVSTRVRELTHETRVRNLKTFVLDKKEAAVASKTSSMKRAQSAK